MDKNLQFVSDIYFVNNGEIDLLTGAMAPERFNQILARDLQLADRNLTQLSIIYAKLNIGILLNNKLSNNQSQLELNKIISDLEAELVRVAFLLKNVFRQSDCICRVHQIGFWIFLVGSGEFQLNQLILRAKQALPPYLELEISHRKKNENQIDWYARVDALYS
jgi:GGDEF domain-containing protein